jgi:threonyl-tRNA synthetase
MCKQFVEAGFMADADLDSSCLLNKKIRNAQLAQYNFILGKKDGRFLRGGAFIYS